MHIRTRSGVTLDTDLLERLAYKQGTKDTISTKEARAEIKKVKTELESNYRYKTDKRSFTRAEKAIANTFNLAIKSGWVKSTTAKSVIAEFLNGDDAGDLKGTLDTIREEAKTQPAPRSSYGSYRRTSWGS